MHWAIFDQNNTLIRHFIILPILGSLSPFKASKFSSLKLSGCFCMLFLYNMYMYACFLYWSQLWLPVSLFNTAHSTYDKILPLGNKCTKIYKNIWWYVANKYLNTTEYCSFAQEMPWFPFAQLFTSASCQVQTSSSRAKKKNCNLIYVCNYFNICVLNDKTSFY